MNLARISPGLIIHAAWSEGDGRNELLDLLLRQREGGGGTGDESASDLASPKDVGAATDAAEQDGSGNNGAGPSSEEEVRLGWPRAAHWGMLALSCPRLLCTQLLMLNCWMVFSPQHLRSLAAAPGNSFQVVILEDESIESAVRVRTTPTLLFSGSCPVQESFAQSISCHICKGWTFLCIAQAPLSSLDDSLGQLKYEIEVINLQINVEAEMARVSAMAHMAWN